MSPPHPMLHAQGGLHPSPVNPPSSPPGFITIGHAGTLTKINISQIFRYPVCQLSGILAGLLSDVKFRPYLIRGFYFHLADTAGGILKSRERVRITLPLICCRKSVNVGAGFLFYRLKIRFFFRSQQRVEKCIKLFIVMIPWERSE